MMRLQSIVLGVSLLLVATGPSTQGQGGRGQANMSPDEQKMAQAIMTAPDAARKVKAGTDFITKYPKSSLRPRVARGLVDEISRVADGSQKVTLAQSYQGVFKEPSEQELIMPILIEGLSQAKRPDEAFSIGSEFVGRSPDSLVVLVQLVTTGTDEAKNKNAKFIPQSLQYGAHAIQLVEADKKPADLDDAEWAKYKVAVLPSLYQSMGILSFMKSDRADAKGRFAKAAELSPTEPFNHLMVASISEEEYQEAAKRYQSMPAGAARDDALQKALAALDGVVEAYAHFVAAAEGNAKFAESRQQSMQVLETYYKYRHKGSTQGLQQIIDKYKTAAKP